MKFECHGCGKVYDDEDGMPINCCGKTLRHRYDGGVTGKQVDEVQRGLNILKQAGDEFPNTKIRWMIDDFCEQLEAKLMEVIKVED